VIVTLGQIEIVRVRPGLFTANANGQGVAAALALRVRADGSQQFEPVSRFDPAQNRFVSTPIDLGPATDQVFLILFGTGTRFRSSLSSVSARIGGVDAPVLDRAWRGGDQGDGGWPTDERSDDQRQVNARKEIVYEANLACRSICFDRSFCRLCLRG
jgi:hypothetical protein